MNRINIPNRYAYLVFSLTFINRAMRRLMMKNQFPSEVWEIIDYEDIIPNMYEISNYGRVRDLVNESIIKSQSDDGRGYWCTSYQTTNGKSRTIKTHRIVAHHFVDGRTEERNEVMHLDGTPFISENGDIIIQANNFFLNLKWGTRSENNKEANEQRTSLRNRKPKINETTAHEICKCLVKHKGDCLKVVNELGIPFKTIQHIWLNSTWKNVYNKYEKDLNKIKISKENK